MKDPDGDDHVTVISNADDDEKTTLVKFTTRKSGKYAISVQVGECHVDGSPFEKTVLSGDVCMSKSHIDKQEKRMVVASGICQTVMIVLRDQYGNLCSRDAFLHEQGLRIHVAEVRRLSLSVYLEFSLVFSRTASMRKPLFSRLSPKCVRATLE